MKISVIIPVLNESARLPGLFKALPAAMKGTAHEILFVDNGSADGSPGLILAFAAKYKHARLLEEKAQGFPEPLNRALSEAKGEIALFLDADALPVAGWASAMADALSLDEGEADIAVGETVSILPKGAGQANSHYGRLAAKLFHGHSKRTAAAVGHALPWGPACNLGVRMSWFATVGPFASAATSAFDIDWCWRAVLAGAQLRFVPKAKVQHFRRTERAELLRQFDRYGRGEAWLHRTYAFLLGPDAPLPDPLLAGVDAHVRLRHHSSAAKLSALAPALDDVAAAFAGGVRVGYELPHRECGLPRPVPTQAVGWPTGKSEYTLFVAGKGVTMLEGEGAKIWEAMRAGATHHELEALFRRLNKCTAEEAHHGIHEFMEAIRP